MNGVSYTPVMFQIKSETTMAETRRVIKFLDDNGITADRISLIREKVTLEQMKTWTITKLKHYFPVERDRNIIINYVADNKDEDGNSNTNKSEVEVAKDYKNVTNDMFQRRNKNLKMRKKERLLNVKLKWILRNHHNEHDFIKIKKSDGGHRETKVSFDTHLYDILNDAKGAFFPDSKNEFGSLTDFQFELLDEGKMSVRLGETFNEFVQRTKFSPANTTFYFATTKFMAEDELPANNLNNSNNIDSERKLKIEVLWANAKNGMNYVFVEQKNFEIYPEGMTFGDLEKEIENIIFPDGKSCIGRKRNFQTNGIFWGGDDDLLRNNCGIKKYCEEKNIESTFHVIYRTMSFEEYRPGNISDLTSHGESSQEIDHEYEPPQNLHELAANSSDLTGNSSGESSSESETLRTLILKLKDKMPSDGTSCMWDVERNDILEKLKCCEEERNLLITFKGEDGKGSGVVKEAFNVALHQLEIDKTIFRGEKGNKYLQYNILSLQRGRYFLTGKVMAMSIIHGGPAPNFLSPTLFCLIAGNDYTVQGCPTENLGKEMGSLVQNLKELQSVSEINNLIADNILLQMAGCQYIGQMADLQILIKGILEYDLVLSVRPCLDSLKEGLKYGGVLQAIQEKPDLFFDCFCYIYGQRLKAETIIEIFQLSSNVNAGDSPEENGKKFFKRYLREIEEGKNKSDVKVEDVLQFATSCSSLPPLGFSITPMIKFHRGRLPSSQTCCNLLYLPLEDNYGTFEAKMDCGIKNCESIDLS